MLAFGMSGIGDVCDRFVQNAAEMEPWEAAIDAGQLPIVKGHKLNDDDKLRRHTILNLMCNLELPWSLTEERWGASVPDLMPEMMKALPALIEDDLCEMDHAGLRITPKGRYFVRNVAMTMDAYLDKGKAIFSKTM